MKAKEFVVGYSALILVLVGGISVLQAATIDTLYNTGVSETGELLSTNEVDPHYTLVFSADAAAPGPEAYTLLPGFPVGPWLAEGPDSKWIAPQADQAVGNAPGLYVFRTTFDLTGYDPTTVRINARLAADNDVRVLLNGLDIGVTVSGFGGFTDIEFPQDAFYYFPDENVIEFEVTNAGDAPNPVGFRAELSGRATTPEDLPSIVTQPSGVNALVNTMVTLSVEADGAVPLSFQWFKDGEAIGGATEASYVISSGTVDDSGTYYVTVSNSLGEVSSEEVTVRIVEPFPGIYGTGVDDNRFVLFDGEEDPHYELIVNPHDSQVTTPVVQNSAAFPIVAGPWVPNSLESAWIGPFYETTNAAGGEYVYRLTFDLTGYDPTTAFVAGRWATDNPGLILLNGAETDVTSPGFTSLTEFELTSGFISGVNQLDFRVTNDGAGYTGLRVENLVAGAEEQTTPILEPRIATQPRDASRILTEALTLTVVADGAQPLSYQWYKDDQPIEGGTSASYTIDSVTGADAGIYTVEVSNAEGSVESEPAEVTVIVPELGVFSTGVDLTGTPLAPGEPDPHYILVSSGDSAFPGPTAYVLSGAPIPPWVANTETSAWIGHRPAGADGAPGAYRYRLIFEVAEEDLATASITGQVATDDGNGGVFLNGTAVDFPPGTGFGGFTELVIPAGSPFVAGLNTLEFVVNNGGAAANPTGLRVENLVISGVTTPDEPPMISVSETGGNIRISWPASDSGYVLQETTSLPGGWTTSPATVTVEGDENVAVVETTGEARFFRLMQ